MVSAADDELLARAQTRLGTILRGKYQLDRVLGVGGMAAVYAATHRNKKKFAVKVLHPELSLRTDIRTRFLREGYAANSVEHPGTVSVLDDDLTDDGSAFLVMELLEGETVEQAWERSGQKVAPQVVLSIGYQLLDVLAAAHAHGIVHRDIKPANLFLTREGKVKVLDFGIARVRDAATSQATQTHAMMGTPAFMAPEQAIGRTAEVDALTDLWAAGATLFTLVSGHLVHEGVSTQEIMVRAATRPAQSLATVMPSAPVPLVRVIDRALAFEKAQRWATAGAMRDAIRDAGETLFGKLSSLSVLDSAEGAVSRTLRSEPGKEAEDPTRLTEFSQPGVWARHTPAVRGLTTAQPVSSDGLRTPRGPKGRRLGIALLAVAGGAVVLAGVVATALRGGAAHPRAGASAPSSIPSAPVPDSAPTGATPVIQATDLPVAAPQPAATLIAPVRRPAPTPQARPVAAPPPPSSGVTRSNCDPPYTLDPKTGTKRWKPECL